MEGHMLCVHMTPTPHAPYYAFVLYPLQLLIACLLCRLFISHRDSVLGSPPHRRLTALLYLSQWKSAEQGGWLRIFTKPNQYNAQPASEASGDATHTLASSSSSSSSSSSHDSTPANEPNPRQLPYFTANNRHSPKPPPSISIVLGPPAATPVPSSSSPSTPSHPPSYIDIAPISGRLVLFSSAEMWHEVRPSFNLHRYAITLWMK